MLSATYTWQCHNCEGPRDGGDWMCSETAFIPAKLRGHLAWELLVHSVIHHLESKDDNLVDVETYLTFFC